jgi:hypothetical protein
MSTVVVRVEACSQMGTSSAINCESHGNLSPSLLYSSSDDSSEIQVGAADVES